MKESVSDISKIRKLYWKDKYSVPQIAKELQIKKDYLYRLMNRNNIPRRTLSESNYLVHKDKPRFNLRKDLTTQERKLRIAGIMLYWAEGAKQGRVVDFANSDSKMIKIFLKFLRQVCGVDERRLRVYLYAYSHQNIKRLREYWCKITNIPLDQFLKPYIRKGNPNLSKRKMPYGLIHVRYSDKRLLELLRQWIEDYVEHVLS